MPSENKRKRLKLGGKVRALRLLQTGSDIINVMNHFGIARRTVRKLEHDANGILKRAEDGTAALQVKSARPAKFPLMEEKVLRFIEIARATKLHLTQDFFQIRALLARDELLKSDLDSPMKESVQKFSTLVGWVQNFVKRHDITSIGLHRQAGSADVAEVAKEMSGLRSSVREYDTKNIYDVGETGLYFKILPRRTYVLCTENRKTLRGIKAMKSKDRITTYFCATATGSDKVPLGIIGTAKNTREFRIFQSPVAYFSNKTA